MMFLRIGATCGKFELYPEEGAAYEALSFHLLDLDPIDFTFTVNDPHTNQGQLSCDFDKRLEEAILERGALRRHLNLSAFGQQLDFAFEIGGEVVAVEVEKANREKILRDILKAHMYLHSGADCALIVLPRNYAHSGGIWDLYDFGVQRFNECRKYGFGRPELLERILILGFTQYDAETGKVIDTAWRQRVRQMAREVQG